MQWVPASSASATLAFRRSPKYLAPTALSVSITVVSAPAPYSTTTPIVEYMNSPQATLTFSAPTGQDSFLIQTYDEPNALGNVLSKAYVTQTVSGTSANVLSATLDGVIASLSLSVSPLQPVAGTPSSMTVSATGYDADGNVIVGPGTYASPIALSIVDPANSGTLSLLRPDLQQPGATSTLSYNGHILVSASVTASLSGVTPVSVTIAPTPSVATYSLPNLGSEPSALTVDASNNLWFTEFAGNRIGELPNGATTFTEHTVPTSSSFPFGIAVGLDGRIWFTEANASKIGAMTTSGSFSEFPTTLSNDDPVLITERGDGTMWYAGAGHNDLGYRDESDPSGGSVALTSGTPFGLAAGPNGLLFFTEAPGSAIGSLFEGSMSPTLFPITLPPTDGGVAAYPESIVAGPDGNMWFVDYQTSAIGRFSTSNSSVVEYSTPTPNAQPEFITVGTDGALWFTESRANKIGRITTGGSITEYSLASNCLGPNGIAVRSNGVVWVTCLTGNALARLIY
jgi:streptogramin lyase